jgi:hypothetical protein
MPPASERWPPREISVTLWRRRPTDIPALKQRQLRVSDLAAARIQLHLMRRADLRLSWVARSVIARE